jgi:flagella basal body P-ring formation protein FlgA
MMQIPFMLALATQPDGCHAVTHEQILASDLAAAIPAFSPLPQDLLIGYAPLAGSRRIFHAVELERIAKVHGLDVASLQDVCFSWNMSAPRAEDLIAAMQASMGSVVAKIQILASSRAAVPAGEIVFPHSGLQLPSPSGPRGEVLWRGYVLYGQNRRFGVWARARIVADVTRVIATADITVGQPIQQEQVRLESYEDFPLDALIARNLDEVVGFISRQSIKSGAPILKNQIEPAPDVIRGDLVKVEVQSGAAHLVLDGRAQQNGAKGSTVLVRNVSSGRSFRAKVVEKGRVMVVPGAIQ